jgi:hypothetical protein
MTQNGTETTTESIELRMKPHVTDRDGRKEMSVETTEGELVIGRNDMNGEYIEWDFEEITNEDGAVDKAEEIVNSVCDHEMFTDRAERVARELIEEMR